MQGFMTDRMNDSHIIHKYFGPYTAKVEKKDYELTNHNSVPFNLSSPTSAGSNNISLFHKTEMNKTNQKEYQINQNIKPN